MKNKNLLMFLFFRDVIEILFNSFSFVYWLFSEKKKQFKFWRVENLKLSTNFWIHPHNVSSMTLDFYI